MIILTIKLISNFIQNQIKGKKESKIIYIFGDWFMYGKIRGMD